MKIKVPTGMGDRFQSNRAGFSQQRLQTYRPSTGVDLDVDHVRSYAPSQGVLDGAVRILDDTFYVFSLKKPAFTEFIVESPISHYFATSSGLVRGKRLLEYLEGYWSAMKFIDASGAEVNIPENFLLVEASGNRKNPFLEAVDFEEFETEPSGPRTVEHETVDWNEDFTPPIGPTVAIKGKVQFKGKAPTPAWDESEVEAYEE